MLNRILGDIRTAPDRGKVDAIWAWASANVTAAGGDLAPIAEACTRRSAELAAALAPPPPPLNLPPPPLPLRPTAAPGPGPAPAQPPSGPEFGAALFPAAPRPPSPLGAPPFHLAKAAELGTGTRSATGLGGSPAFDALRAELVNLAACAWDCGVDLSRIDGLRDVSQADAEKVWEIVTLMCEVLRTRLEAARGRR